MVTRSSCYLPVDIERYLCGELDAQAQVQLESHLDECLSCRKTVKQQAADADFWQAARNALGSDAATALMPVAERSDESNIDPSKGKFDPLAFVKSWLGPTDDPKMMGRLAAYEIVGVIGFGGMGIVLKGFETSLNRYVAIKVLSPHLAPSGAARQRFAREAKAAAAVVHENVVSIHAVDEWNSLPYIVMSYVRGESLQKRIDRHGQHTAEEVLRIARQITVGLNAAHTLGLVHRDVKPANILLEESVDRLWLTDFGLARASDDANMTTSGVIVGTPQYMSPEQIRGETIDHRSDLFSLGSVLYTLCVGHTPFRAETTFGVMRRITDEQCRPIRDNNSAIPPWLCRMIERLHDKNPMDRYESASQLGEHIEACIAHLEQPDQHTLPAQLLVEPKNERGRPTAFAWLKYSAAGVALLIIAVMISRLPPLQGKRDDNSPVATAERSKLPFDKSSPANDTKEKSFDSGVEHTTRPHSPKSEIESDSQQITSEATSSELPFEYLRGDQTEFAYRANMVAELDHFEAVLDGIVIYKVESRDGDLVRLRCESNMQVEDRYLGRGLPSQHAWSRPHSSIYSADGDRTTLLTINKLGEIIEYTGDCELPYRLGQLPVLPFQPLDVVVDGEWSSQRLTRLTTFVPRYGAPVFVTSAADRFATTTEVLISNQLKSGDDRTLQFEQTFELALTGTSQLVGDQFGPPFGPRFSGRDPVTIDFKASGRSNVTVDVNSGLIESLELNQTNEESDRNMRVQVPIRLTLSLMSPDERMAFAAERAAEAQRQREEMERPFTREEAEQCVADLSANKKVLNWLHRISPKPPENISSDIIDAVAVYREHENQNYRELAKQIISKVPYDQVSPFRVVD